MVWWWGGGGVFFVSFYFSPLLVAQVQVDLRHSTGCAVGEVFARNHY